MQVKEMPGIDKKARVFWLSKRLQQSPVLPGRMGEISSATTFSITTFSIMTLSISIYKTRHSVQMTVGITPLGITLSVIMLSVTMLSVISWVLWHQLKWRLSTVDPLIKVACFVTKVKNICSIKMRWSKLVSTMLVQSYWAFPFSKGSLAKPTTLVALASHLMMVVIISGLLQIS